MSSNGRPVYVSDLNELRDWIDDRFERYRNELVGDLASLKHDILKIIEDHEARLRDLEKTRWKAAGWAAAFGSLLGVFSSRLLNLLFRS